MGRRQPSEAEKELIGQRPTARERRALPGMRWTSFFQQADHTDGFGYSLEAKIRRARSIAIEYFSHSLCLLNNKTARSTCVAIGKDTYFPNCSSFWCGLTEGVVVGRDHDQRQSASQIQGTTLALIPNFGVVPVTSNTVNRQTQD